MGRPIPDPVQTVMLELSRGLSAILGGRLLGLYLGGSAGLDDFCEASSDVDFLAVTVGPLTAEDAAEIATLHDRLRHHEPYGDRLEGDYAPRDLLVPEGTLAPVPLCEHGVFSQDVQEIMLSADNIMNLREDGIVFFGPDPHVLLPPVTADQVRAAVRAMLADGPGHADTPERAASAILNLVRSLCALERGRPCTKSAGARWSFDHLDPRWHPSIRSALAIRRAQASPRDGERVQATVSQMYGAHTD
jgi:hypothetical protein